MNNEVFSPERSTHVFIVRWDSRAPSDQTNSTKRRDDSLKAVEEASRRGEQTLAIGGRPALEWGRPAPHGGRWLPPRVGCLLECS